MGEMENERSALAATYEATAKKFGGRNGAKTVLHDGFEKRPGSKTKTKADDRPRSDTKPAKEGEGLTLKGDQQRNQREGLHLAAATTKKNRRSCRPVRETSRKASP